MAEQAGLKLFPAKLTALEFTEQPPEPWKPTKLTEFGVTLVTGYISMFLCHFNDSQISSCRRLSQPAFEFTKKTSQPLQVEAHRRLELDIPRVVYTRVSEMTWLATV
ncbi:hypothetical protein NEUTE1DRAFT_113881 [Neurospora tetrasperma FGSC 2508]|uniref:Uncharacterized protein n=1 Tax=Neurospora tetrasperma (strain FGSC 2508 / ATCC MYA-4615 / P0657) TaxID=510951 RepID=F8N4A6_NEUT8|nr:uncharacterized protein NEUTE1DRAFT_113881 [Neurospora tetrasperma FGSC 2508]EGO51849.1 hypothetical protein NEUTE1DRAFT_113881 [Neurospora tetrasperma FGSC 2508]